MSADPKVLPSKADWRTSIGRTLAVFAVFSFLFHFAREISQAPLFAKMPVTIHWQATLMCLRATLGDVGIALASFATANWWDRSLTWFAGLSNGALAGYLATGVLITIAFEWYAVFWAGRWSYSELMPVVPLLHVGLAPLMQWIVLPMAVLSFLRCHRPAGGEQCQ